jgi:hypothetical protein
MENIRRNEHELRLYAEEGVARVPGLRMIALCRDVCQALRLFRSPVK